MTHEPKMSKYDLHNDHECDPGPCLCACGCERELGCRYLLGSYCTLCHIAIVYDHEGHGKKEQP